MPYNPSRLAPSKSCAAFSANVRVSQYEMNVILPRFRCWTAPWDADAGPVWQEYSDVSSRLAPAVKPPGA